MAENDEHQFLASPLFLLIKIMMILKIMKPMERERLLIAGVKGTK